jgi:hypothetical protein
MTGIGILQLVFVIFALGCALIAAFFYEQPSTTPRRPHFGWLSMAFFFISVLIGYIPK